MSWSCSTRRRLRGDFINVCKDLMGGKAAARPFLVDLIEKTRGNGQKLKYKQFCSNIRKKFLTVRVLKHWNSFAWRDCGVSSLRLIQNLTGHSPVQSVLADPA